MSARTCEAVMTVSDRDFGFWHPSFGEPVVVEIPCEEPAVVVIVVICEHGADEISLCADHAPEELTR